MTVPAEPHLEVGGGVRVLVSAASRHGATAEIASAIGAALARQGVDATVLAPEEVTEVESYDAVVLGSATYQGHWLGPAKDLAGRFADDLAARPVWLFSSGPVGDPERKLVKQMGQDPVDVADIVVATRARDHRVFAGRLDRGNLGVVQRAAMVFFRNLEGDFRDWDEIEAWAQDIARHLVTTAP
ncbi:MAG TPA: flavodoxin domain-containing protein [Acidimicrobiales bacterium]|nr:flavodoxin domain-containing protein [Acidimicrobiales bacterium]